MRRHWQGVVVGLGLMLAPCVWAGGPEVVIYCATDRVVYGYVKPGQSVEQSLSDIKASAGYQADCNAELKTVTLPEGRPKFERAVVAVDGNVATELYPEYVAQQEAAAATVTKLKALGLTEAEIATLK